MTSFPYTSYARFSIDDLLFVRAHGHRQSMRIWLVQPSEQLPIRDDARKLRTQLLAAELARRGHEVTWWASCFNHLRKTWEFSEDTTFSPSPNATIHALKGLGYRRNVSLRRWLDHKQLSRKFRAMARTQRDPDIVITSLPPHDLAAEAVLHAKECGALACVDIRDKWPDNLVDVMPKTLQSLARRLLARDFAAKARALVGADVLFSMTEPLLEWGLQAAGRPRRPDDRVFYLGAYRESAAPPSAALERLVSERLSGRFVVTFIGTFSAYHDPSAMIEAARMLRHRTDIVFVLAGEGDGGRELRTRAIDLPNVVFTGWLDSPAMSFVLKNSRLGLCTSGRHSERFFLPNKVFSYLADGLPIGSVFDGELRDLIDAKGFGFNFRTARELASTIGSLATSPERYGRMVKAARAFFDAHCEAGAIYRSYADLVEELGSNRRGPMVSQGGDQGPS